MTDTSDVPPRSRERLDQAIFYRIAHAGHEDRNRMILGFLLGDLNRRSGYAHNDIRLIGNELAGELS